ncbi:hypothetical protein HK098_007018 [Nowakowskiella sp. JEL0407]|nr:hypothetical protein HK098_007018 [Nowakowskiella sp. JEL0407]
MGKRNSPSKRSTRKSTKRQPIIPFPIIPDNSTQTSSATATNKKSFTKWEQSDPNNHVWMKYIQLIPQTSYYFPAPVLNENAGEEKQFYKTCPKIQNYEILKQNDQTPDLKEIPSTEVQVNSLSEQLVSDPMVAGTTDVENLSQRASSMPHLDLLGSLQGSEELNHSKTPLIDIPKIDMEQDVTKPVNNINLELINLNLALVEGKSPKEIAILPTGTKEESNTFVEVDFMTNSSNVFTSTMLPRLSMDISLELINPKLAATDEKNQEENATVAKETDFFIEVVSTTESCTSLLLNQAQTLVDLIPETKSAELDCEERDSVKKLEIVN